MIYLCPHCGKPQPVPPPASFRRSLVFGVGFELLLLSIFAGSDVIALRAMPVSFLSSASLVLGLWGTAYSTYLWISFLLIGSLRLPGCEFTALSHVISERKVHRCVDTVLNSVMDLMQDERGLSPELLRTESAQKWLLGLFLLAIFVGFIAAHIVSMETSATAVAIFAVVYFVYDKTMHEVSIGRKDLTGSGDYPRILWGIILKILHIPQ